MATVEDKMFEGQPKGFPFGDFELDDVMLPEGDDMGVPSEDEEEQEELEADTGFGSVVVIDGLPQVPAEKFEKLTSIVRKIAGGPGRVREGGLHHPVDAATGLSKGFAFVEYERPEAARAARDALDGYALDKAHRFRASMFDDFDRLARLPAAYAEPPAAAYEPRPDLLEWLSDRRGRDQVVLRFGDESEVAWNEPARQQFETAYRRSFWTEAPYVVWSPRGALAATMHAQGVAVWGGAAFDRVQRFSHAGVQRAVFSPCERYLYTFSEAPAPGGRGGGGPAIALSVFDVRSGRKLRSFDGPAAEWCTGAAARPDGGLAFPAFKWAGAPPAGGGADPLLGPPPRAYLAAMKKGAIAVYEAPDMGLVDKKSVKMEGVVDFEWSPADPVLAAYQAEQGNLPARVVLLRAPDRAELRQKNLFSVADVKLAWHPQGDFLAVKVDKFTKTRKSTTANLEIFSLRERDCPVDMLELPNRSDKITGLSWEPRGARFAVVHGDPPRPSVSFYAVGGKPSGAGAGAAPGGGAGAAPAPAAGGSAGGSVAHVATLASKAVSSVHWSPAGRFAVLAGLKYGHNGALEFWDVDDVSLLAAAEHFLATDVEWDPTGRFVMTSVTADHQMENGVAVWSFAGQPLYKVSRDRLFQAAWRPRPPTLLSDEAQRGIAKSLKKYSRRYEEEDEKLLHEADSELLAERARLAAEWRDWLASHAAWVAEQAAFRRAAYGARWREGGGAHVLQEVEVSSVVDVKEEPYRPN